MNRTLWMTTLLLSALLVPALAVAQDAPAKSSPVKVAPATPAAAPAPKLTMPAPLPAVPATVGGVKIEGARINKSVATAYAQIMKDIPRMLSQIPADRQGAALKYYQNILNNLPTSQLQEVVFFELQKKYITIQKISCTDDEYKTFRTKVEQMLAQRKLKLEQMLADRGWTEADLRIIAAWETYVKTKVGPKAVADFIRVNPNLFNGTKRNTSHVLILCDPLASTKTQKAVIAELARIAAEVKAKKIAFADAAMKYSDDPSSRGNEMTPGNKGSMGNIVFFDPVRPLVPTFSYGAFHCTIGGMITPVRTNYGFHLIQAITETPAPKDAGTTDALAKNAMKARTNNKAAQDLLGAQLQNSVLDMALNGCDIVYEASLQAKMDKAAAAKKAPRPAAKAKVSEEVKAAILKTLTTYATAIQSGNGEQLATCHSENTNSAKIVITRSASVFKAFLGLATKLEAAYGKGAASQTDNNLSDLKNRIDAINKADIKIKLSSDTTAYVSFPESKGLHMTKSKDSWLIVGETRKKHFENMTKEQATQYSKVIQSSRKAVQNAASKIGKPGETPKTIGAALKEEMRAAAKAAPKK